MLKKVTDLAKVLGRAKQRDHKQKKGSGGSRGAITGRPGRARTCPSLPISPYGNWDHKGVLLMDGKMSQQSNKEATGRAICTAKVP